VTGLTWPRFTAAHAPGFMLAALVGGAAAVGAHLGRLAHLGNLLVIVAAALTAALAIAAASWLRPAAFLGPHGTWARRQAEQLVQGARRGTPGKRVQMEELAGLGEGTSK
jgi:hypothetical protein